MGIWTWSAAQRAASLILVKQRVLCGLAIACLLWMGNVARCETASPATQKPGATTPSATAHAGTASAPGSSTGAPVSRNLREAMAQLLEASLAYRTAMDSGAPKLLAAQFAGPLQKRMNLFASPQTVYCASAKIDIWPFPYERTAVLLVEPGENGQERIRATIGMNNTPFACRLVKYGPFPELEAARQKRRQALGKTG